MSVKIKDVFGKLLVVAEDGFVTTSGGYRKRKVLVECACGTRKSVRVNDLTSGRTISCGCHLKEITTKRNTTHGMSGTRIFAIYCGMVKRCTNPNCDDFKRYGSLHHDVNWFHSFEKFYEDMGATYVDGYSLDRVDGSLGYSKTNCRWIPPEMQARNNALYENNTSGITGVSFASTVKTDGSTDTVATARWCEDGQQRTKSFSVLKYGLLEAFSMAVQYRKDQIARLNELGYGYTDTHGL